MSDSISRQAAIDMWKEDFKGFVNSLDILRDDYKGIMEYIDEVPSAQPYALDEWCDTCKEYDHEKHCCPRYNRVIRDALKMLKRGKWITKSTNGEMFDCCSVCGYVEWDNPKNFCPNCGADMRGEEDGKNS